MSLEDPTLALLGNLSGSLHQIVQLKVIKNYQNKMKKLVTFDKQNFAIF